MISLDKFQRATYELPTFDAITALSLTLWKQKLKARTNRHGP